LTSSAELVPFDSMGYSERTGPQRSSQVIGLLNIRLNSVASITARV
jgi:hypothetical protein